MTIQGGGKYTPAPHAGAADRPRRAAEKRQAREADVGERPKTRAQDVFVSGAPNSPTSAAGISGPLATGPRLEDLVTTASQIRKMAEAIAAHSAQLSAEFDGLRGEAQRLVQGLAEKGFVPEVLEESRAELGVLRTRMAQLRRKMATDGRRMKLLRVAANKAGETKLSDKVAAQLASLGDMERGWGRAFLALGLAGTFPMGPNPETRPLRLSVPPGNVDQHTLGSYIAQAAPGTAVSQLLVALVADGPAAPPGRLVAEAYAEIHADALAGRMGKSLQGLGLWRLAMG
jgi:hypothetical protein